MGFTADILQFVVAAYALRLNRLFGTARVGWSLFCAFSLLGILHFIQTVMPNDESQFGGNTELVYSIISLLLLTGMVHMEIQQKERLRVAGEEQLMRIGLESEVKRKTAHLTQIIEELRLEMDRRQHMERAVETSQGQLAAASRRAEMAEIGANVLGRMGRTLKSVSISTSLLTDRLRESKIANVVRIGALLREHAPDIGDFMARDPRGQKLPVYIAQLSEHLAHEHTALAGELEFIKKNIKEILAMQRNYAGLAGVADLIESSHAVKSGRPWDDTQFFREFKPQPAATHDQAGAG